MNATVETWLLTRGHHAPPRPFPSSAAIRAFSGNFCGVPIPLPIQGNGPASTGRVLFQPAYMQYTDPGLRREIRRESMKVGTHFVVNLSNHSSIYRDWYAAWDETQVNMFLEELNADGFIVVGSCFPDGSTYLNPVVEESLVHAVFWWEDPTPINKPALDSNNKFWLARQYFPRQEIYWHNPVGQDAPYVNPPDWGATWDPVTKRWSSVNAAVWQYLQANNLCRGLMFQGRAWESAHDSVLNLQDFLDRLPAGKLYGVDMDVVDFEEVAYYVLDLSGDLGTAAGWTGSIRSALPALAGYDNG